jgi:flagellar motility protein MotE (MotC chaperone)
MKNLFNVAILVLALNFLAVAGGVGYLVQDKRLDREKVLAIKEILFPPPAPATQPSTRPAATTQPLLKLEELLAAQSGRGANEQVQFIQHTFDAQASQLDRRQRELADLKRQVDIAQAQLSKDRADYAKQRESLQAEQKKATELAQDKGFQDSLALYNTMPSKQAKTVFMGLSDETVVNYLQAMEPKTATKILKEFKAPAETERVQKLMEMMRRTQPAREPPKDLSSPQAKSE